MGAERHQPRRQSRARTFITPAQSQLCAKRFCTAGPASPSRILPQEWTSRTIGRARTAGSVRVLAELLPARSSREFSTTSICRMLAPDAPDPEVVWCPLDPNPLPLNYRHEERAGFITRVITICATARPAPTSTSASAARLRSRRCGFSETSPTARGGPQNVEKKSRGEPFGEDEEHELVLTISRDVERMRHCQRKVDPEAISVQP